MHRLISIIAIACSLLMLFAGCGEQPSGDKETEKTTLFDYNSGRLVGVWQMDTYAVDQGETYQFWDQKVLFVYNEDGSGQKSVGDTVEYTMTYTYNGTNLYTTAYYPDLGETHLRNDLCTAETDTLIIYSYDERATITLRRVDPATVTIPTLPKTEE